MIGYYKEGAINLIVVSPLLEIAGFLYLKFRIRVLYAIFLELEDPDEIVGGFIDTLIVQQQL